MDAQHKINSLLDQLNTVIVGKKAQVQDCVACLLAGGHLLIEDVPGVGKTTLAHALSRTFGLQFSRVQFTADLMPSDLTGVSVYERGKESSLFHPGPVFAQVLLADEINRASPKTQSALLEAMEEKQVSVEGATRPLPHPFFVIATQNPQDQLGTFALPVSQLDRFLVRISIGFRAMKKTSSAAPASRPNSVRYSQPMPATPATTNSARCQRTGKPAFFHHSTPRQTMAAPTRAARRSSIQPRRHTPSPGAPAASRAPRSPGTRVS